MKLFSNNYLSSFLGLDMSNDEYQRQQGYIILANCFNYLFYLLTITMMISLIWDLYHQTISTGTISIFLLLQCISIYILNQTRKTQSDTTEVYSIESYKNEMKKIRVNSIKLGLYWGSSMYVINEIIFIFVSGEKYTFNWFSLILWIIVGSFLFGISMYFMTKIKLINEDEGE